MRTYLIIGGLGFIGHNIAKQLIINSNNKVIIYDAYKHFLPFNIDEWKKSIEYRTNEITNKNLKIIEGDCLDDKLLKSTINEYKPDIIFHLSSLPIAGIANNLPLEAKLNIFDSTFTLLEILKDLRFPCPKLVFSSSSMVYGHFNRDDNNDVIHANENQRCVPIGIYGAMKLSCENIIRAYYYKYKIPYTIIRPSAVYGPSDCNMRVTEIFIKNALKKEALILDDGGCHKLDFTYVTDTAKGFVLAADNKASVGETFNISAGNGRQIKELAQIIEQYIPETKIKDGTLFPYRPNRGSLNIKKAERLLGFKPEYDLETGMKLYLNFLQK